MTRKKQLEELHKDIRKCTLCPLHETRTNAVPGEGPATSRVMFVGEAPGAREDESGSPFVGKSGALLTLMIQEIGLSRDTVFITSILKSRPPKNRTPTQIEISACRPYLERQIEIIDPQVVVLLGRVAISALIGPWKVSEAHGKFYETDDRKYFMTYHPAAALRFPTIKSAMRKDFQTLSQELV
jgi:uracil-DNA glycosylase family 4